MTSATVDFPWMDTSVMGFAFVLFRMKKPWYVLYSLYSYMIFNASALHAF